MQQIQSVPRETRQDRNVHHHGNEFGGSWVIPQVVRVGSTSALAALEAYLSLADDLEVSSQLHSDDERGE